MSWKDRSKTLLDVVYFSYSSPGVQSQVDEVFVWDIDKTYLDTEIDSLRGLFATAVERAFLKKNVSGTATLLKTMAASWSEHRAAHSLPLFFISASPPQMEERLNEKFAIDKVKPFGCFYKDNLKNLRPSRLWRLKKQVGYKLQALMQLRLTLKPDVRQILWGDDSEADATIYNLYSDICARRRTESEFREILKFFSVTPEQIDLIMRLQKQAPTNDPVERIYINLAIDTDPDFYLKFGRRTVATANSFQVALDLYQNQKLNLEGVKAVADDLLEHYDFSKDELEVFFDDLVRRKVIGAKAFTAIQSFLKDLQLLAPSYKPTLEPAAEVEVINGFVRKLDGQFEPWVVEQINYTSDNR